MKLKLQLPKSTKVVTLESSATLDDLYNQIDGIPSKIKFGFPPQSAPLENVNATLESIGIKHGDQLNIELVDGVYESGSQKPTDTKSKGSSSEPSNATPEVPCGNGYLKLRVMEDDNSCMFASIGYDMFKNVNTMFELRNIVADGIRNNPVEYNDAILGQKASEYIKWILKESSWGGAIELNILSKHFDVTIACLDVSTLQVHNFNPGQNRFIAVVYSGIHYDAVALSPSKGETSRGSADDTTVFEADEKGFQVLESLKALGQQLKDKHYYTDTASFQIKCNNCGQILKGEKEASKHAMTTGHSDFGEV